MSFLSEFHEVAIKKETWMILPFHVPFVEYCCTGKIEIAVTHTISFSLHESVLQAYFTSVLHLLKSLLKNFLSSVHVVLFQVVAFVKLSTEKWKNVTSGV